MKTRSKRERIGPPNNKQTHKYQTDRQVSNSQANRHIADSRRERARPTHLQVLRDRLAPVVVPAHRIRRREDRRACREVAHNPLPRGNQGTHFGIERLHTAPLSSNLRRNGWRSMRVMHAWCPCAWEWQRKAEGRQGGARRGFRPAGRSPQWAPVCTASHAQTEWVDGRTAFAMEMLCCSIASSSAACPRSTVDSPKLSSAPHTYTPASLGTERPSAAAAAANDARRTRPVLATNAASPQAV